MGAGLSGCAKSRGRPPHVVVEAQALRPPVSGVGRAVYELLRRLPSVAPDMRFTVWHPRGAPVPREVSSERFVFRAPLAPTFLRPVRLAWQQCLLPLHLRLGGADLLHSTSYTTALAASTPTVLTVYDTIALRFPRFCTRLNALHYRRFMPLSARRARRIIVPSEAAKRAVMEDLGVSEERIRLVPLGVAETFRPVTDADELGKAREELGLPARYILYVGNIEPRKNLTGLIEAVVEAHRAGRCTHRLVIAGRKGWRCADVFAAARHPGAAALVQVLNDVPSRLLPALYSGASVCVLPSLYEGFGLPALEAMACGAPVVATTAGALPEVVGDAALSVRPDDVRELRVAIEKVLANRFLAQRLRESGIRRAVRFTWEKAARMTADVYREVLAEVTSEE